MMRWILGAVILGGVCWVGRLVIQAMFESRPEYQACCDEREVAAGERDAARRADGTP